MLTVSSSMNENTSEEPSASSDGFEAAKTKTAGTISIRNWTTATMKKGKVRMLAGAGEVRSFTVTVRVRDTTAEPKH